MAIASSRHSPSPVSTNPPNNESSEQIRDELEPNSNANKERGLGGLAENMSNTPEKAPDNGIKPNNANENPAVSIEGSLAKNMSDTLGQILNVLQDSTNTKERRKDDNSKFWATYNKVLTEYDNDLAKQMHSDINIILTFGGLLSTVIATFIVGMQPNPGDTTNALLVQLIHLTVNGTNSVPDISNLSSSMQYPSSNVLAQELAYSGLLLSLFAAFSAVVVKNHLNFNKQLEEGTLEERGIRRQTMLDMSTFFQLDVLLNHFFTLLQLSLSLLCGSLVVNMHAQQHTIYKVIVYVLSAIIIFCMGILMMYPGSPGRIIISRPDIFTKSSAIRWILEKSTNPEFVDAAAAMVPFVQWPQRLNVSASYSRLLEILPRFRDMPELYVKYHKALAHLCIQPVEISSRLLEYAEFGQTRIRLIREAFMAGHNAYKLLNSKDTQEADAQQKLRADIRTALRTVVVHGHANRLSRPDDEDLIWHGDWRWNHSDEHEPSYEDFDWLVDHLADNTIFAPADSTAGNAHMDDETKGDALLALSAMQGLGSPTKRQSYIESLIFCMDSTRPPRVRHSALRAVFEAREELASMQLGLDAQLLDELSRALLTVVCPKDGQTTYNTEPHTYSHIDRDSCYIRIIYTLIKDDEWCQRLTRTNDDHLARWISLVDRDHVEHDPLKFLLLMIFWHIKSSGKDIGISPADERWRLLITDAWRDAQSIEWDDYVDGIPAFVTATKLNWTASDNREWFTDLAPMVHATLVRLQEPERQATLRDGGVAQDTIDAALFSMQGLKGDLCRITKDETPRKEVSVELRDIEGKY